VEWCERRVDESFYLFHNNDLNTFGAKVMFYSDVAWFFSAFFRCADRQKMYDDVAPGWSFNTPLIMSRFSGIVVREKKPWII
jgi:hypothetical protein